MAWLGVYSGTATSRRQTPACGAVIGRGTELRPSGRDFCEDGSAEHFDVEHHTDGYSRLNENPGNERVEYRSLDNDYNDPRIVGRVRHATGVFCGGPVEASARFAADPCRTRRR